MTIYINGTSGISGVDGSAGTPAIQGTDANTGISFPAADTVAINTGGSERSRVDSSGRLLVGTSSARETTSGNDPLAQFERAGGSGLLASCTRNSNDAFGPRIALIKSRGSTVGSNTVVQSGDAIGGILFHGTDGTNPEIAALIQAEVDGTPGANDMPGRIVLATTADGASSPTERMRISANGLVQVYAAYTSTTAAAANVNVDSNGYFQRSTSSAKYKTNIETLQDSYSDALLNCRPVWYQSTCEKDNPNWGWWGFIAEEVAEIDPRLVHWKTTETSHDENGSVVETPLETPEPEGVQYDRFVPHLLNLIKRQKEQIEALEARLTAAGI